MKRFFQKILSAVMVLAVITASAPIYIGDINTVASASEETRKSTENLKGLQYTDEYAYHAYGDYGISIHKYIGEAGEYIEIPSEIDGYTVEHINERAFSPGGLYNLDSNTWKIPKNESLNNLKEVSVPPTVKKINSYAFSDCKNLEKVNLSEGLEGMNWGVFKGCEKLTSINFPSTLYYIYSHSFDGTAVTEMLFEKNTIYDCFDVSGYMFSGSKVVKCTVKGDGARVWKDAFRNSVVEEVIFEGTITLWEEPVLYAKNNTVEKIVFKAGMPEGVYESLTTDYGYYLHTDSTDGSVYFDKNPEDENAFSSGDFVYTLDAEQQAIITKYTGTKTDVTVPQFVDGYPVVQIGGFAFANTEITSVNLPDTVEKIGIYAFYNCNTLKQINTPQSLKEINGYAFYGCTSLESFDVPQRLKYLGAYAFSRCESIENICIPDTITKIHNGVFMGCTGLKDVKMSSNIRSIGISSFEGTTSLENLNFTESLVIIDDRAFHSSGIKSVVFPSSLEYLMEDVFDSSGVVNAVINGKDIEIYWAFDDCLQLETVEFKNGVKAIMGGAFDNCPSLKTIIIPERLESIELYAFQKCPNIDTIYYNAINCEVDTNLQNPKHSVFENCNVKNIVIGDKVEYIGTALFMECDGVESVKIPDTVTKVARYAFYGCDDLVSIEWDADNKYIGKRAFAACPKLADFNFNNIEKSYSNSFSGSGISKAQIGETKTETASNLQVIEEQTFMDCEKLETIGIGGNVTTIETQAFANCENLETAVISDSVTEIADDAFDGCDNLTIYCSEDSYAYSYAQTQGIKVSTFVIAPIPNQTYTGFEITPEVSVSLSGDTLDKNVDFGVTYANNINIGNADVTVKGKGDFRMFASRANFAIVTKNISAAVIADIPAQDYTGSAVTPSITVTDGANILREGIDYTVTYSDNIKEGTAKAHIKGIGNYSGTASASFEIEQMSVVQRIISAVTSFFNSITARIIAFFMGLFM